MEINLQSEQIIWRMKSIFQNGRNYSRLLWCMKYLWILFRARLSGDKYRLSLFPPVRIFILSIRTSVGTLCCGYVWFYFGQTNKVLAGYTCRRLYSTLRYCYSTLSREMQKPYKPVISKPISLTTLPRLLSHHHHHDHHYDHHVCSPFARALLQICAKPHTQKNCQCLRMPKHLVTARFWELRIRTNRKNVILRVEPKHERVRMKFIFIHEQKSMIFRNQGETVCIHVFCIHAQPSI